MIPAMMDGLRIYDALKLTMEPFDFLQKIWAPYVHAHGVPTAIPPEWQKLRGVAKPQVQ